MRIIKAPFTDNQVANLNEWQDSEIYHAFTCSNRGDGKHEYGGRLIADQTRGWFCPDCDYTQDWAHDFMADGSGLKAAKEIRAKVKIARKAANY